VIDFLITLEKTHVRSHREQLCVLVRIPHSLDDRGDEDSEGLRNGTVEFVVSLKYSWENHR